MAALTEVIPRCNGVKLLGVLTDVQDLKNTESAPRLRQAREENPNLKLVQLDNAPLPLNWRTVPENGAPIFYFEMGSRFG